MIRNIPLKHGTIQKCETHGYLLSRTLYCPYCRIAELEQETADSDRHYKLLQEQHDRLKAEEHKQRQLWLDDSARLLDDIESLRDGIEVVGIVILDKVKAGKIVLDGIIDNAKLQGLHGMRVKVVVRPDGL